MLRIQEDGNRHYASETILNLYQNLQITTMILNLDIRFLNNLDGIDIILVSDIDIED